MKFCYRDRPNSELIPYVPFSKFCSSSSTPGVRLYRRISPLGDPRLTIVPVLDQWVEEGNEVCPGEVRGVVRTLHNYMRYKHALEVSHWMTDKRGIPLETRDVVMRMKLIFQVNGIQKAEDYFKESSGRFRNFPVYTALLNCYVVSGDVGKAEGLMEEMKMKGYIRNPICYNLLLKLYSKKGNREMMETLMLEMKERFIDWDDYTYMIWLSALADSRDIEGIEKMVEKMLSDTSLVMDHNVYAIVANAYVKVGQLDKALENMGKLELRLGEIRNKAPSLHFLLHRYSISGKKEDVYRVLDTYKKTQVIYNKGFMVILRALMRINDVDGAEAIFREWEPRGLSYDFRIPDFLIGFYCRNKMLDKAEALVARGVERGGLPTVATWCYLANAHMELDQDSKAVEVLKKATTMDVSMNWKPSKQLAETCLLCLEGNGDPKLAYESAEILKAACIFSERSINRMMSCYSGGRGDPVSAERWTQ